MTIVDGRTQRGERNREAIVEALVECYGDGLLQPSVDEVAARAGVSARSVHNHFVDVEALRAAVYQGAECSLAVRSAIFDAFIDRVRSRWDA